MKVSVIVTVLNEEKTMGELFESLFNQTQIPDEIVVVDGGSSDQTVAKILGLAKRSGAGKNQIKNREKKLRLFIKPGCSIAQGRNLGIIAAKNEIIAMTDAGCIAQRDWLEKITAPFKQKNVELVAGFYQMTGELPFQRAVAPFLGVPPNRFNTRTFLPSARSMAFRKSLWEKVGGFSQKFDWAGEDTFFNYQAIRSGVKIVRVEKAIVYWEMPEGLLASLKKFYGYARGDAWAGIWWHPTQQKSTHNLKITGVFARYILGFAVFFFSFHFSWLMPLLVAGFLFYLFWSIWKMRDIITDWRVRLWLPAIQVLSDLAVMTGFLVGFLGRRVN